MENHKCEEEDFKFLKGFNVCTICGNSIDEFGYTKVGGKTSDKHSRNARRFIDPSLKSLHNRDYNFQLREQHFYKQYNSFYEDLKKIIEENEKPLLKTEFFNYFEKLSLKQFKIINQKRNRTGQSKSINYYSRFIIIVFYLLKYFWKKQIIEKYYHKRNLISLFKGYNCSDSSLGMIQHKMNKNNTLNKLFKEVILKGI
jgi:hypothetical protein